jgi:hypothetical protein
VFFAPAQIATEGERYRRRSAGSSSSSNPWQVVCSQVMRIAVLRGTARLLVASMYDAHVDGALN